MTRQLVEEAVAAGASIEASCEILGLSARTLVRWKLQEGKGVDRRASPRHAPAHKLTEAERATIVATCNSEEFRDVSPKQIVPRLADRGTFVASESSFYRVLRAEGLVTHRTPARPPTHHRPKELVAAAPNQVWTWDITYLRASVRGTFYYLYLMLDVFSRKIVGWTVETEESMTTSAALLERTCGEAVEQVINELGANVLIIEYPHHGYRSPAGMVDRFIGQPPAPPAAAERDLADLHLRG